MQLVKKKKGKKRPGYRGAGGYQGGRKDTAPGAAKSGPVDRGPGGDAGNKFTQFTKEVLNPQVDTFQQAYKEPGLFGFGGGYRDLNVAGDTSQGFKRGIGSTVLGGILSLVNPALGLAFRGVNFMRDKVPETFQNFQSSNTLEEFIDKMRGYGRTIPNVSTNPFFGGIESLGIFEDEEDPITGTNYPGSNMGGITNTGIEGIDVGYPSNDLMAFNAGTKLDRTLKNMYSGYENLGIKNPQMIDLMKRDIQQNLEKGTPLSLPKNAYSLIG